MIIKLESYERLSLHDLKTASEILHGRMCQHKYGSQDHLSSYLQNKRACRSF